MKIKIEQFRSSYRLRFTYPPGNRNTVTAAPATKAGLVKAQQVAQLIELDILNNAFDNSLNKYSFSALPKDTATIWSQYKEAKQNITAITTQLESWKQTDTCISKLPAKLLALDKADEAIAFLLTIYSPGTLGRSLANLRAACNLALQKQQIKFNPYTHIKLSQNSTIIECFSDEDIKTIFAAFEDTRYANYVQFLALTFCRPEEACGLTINDIDLSSKIIRFKNAYSRGVLKVTKNNKIKLFPISSSLEALLVNQMLGKADILFTNSKGGYLEHRSWSRDVWKPIVTKLAAEGKIKKYLKCYCLRHSGITRCIRNGYDVATTAALAGTSSEMIFRNYLAAKDVTKLELPNIE